MKFHLIGNGSRKWIKTVALIILVEILMYYINYAYLQLSFLQVALGTLLVTITGLYFYKRKKFRDEFEKDFAEALNIINSSLRANNTIVRGINECGDKMTGALGKEFSNVAQRLEIGESAESVFADSYKRFPFKEYYFFILTVKLNINGGGQVKDIMAKLGALISMARVIERKKMAMTSEARMSVKILAVIPVLFILFMKFCQPKSFDILMYSHAGQIILYSAVGSILTGLFIVWLMMNKI
ncbi:TPA: type II secretion system F family protein [Enterobacter hormaechei]